MTAPQKSRSVLRRAVDQMVSAREQRVQRYVNGYLLTLDDATLAASGHDRETLRRKGAAIYPF